MSIIFNELSTTYLKYIIPNKQVKWHSWGKLFHHLNALKQQQEDDLYINSTIKQPLEANLVSRFNHKRHQKDIKGYYTTTTTSR